MLQQNQSIIRQLQRNFEREYKKSKSIKMPFFTDEVLFTNYGLKHIFIDSNREYRAIEEIQNRIKLFKYIFVFLPLLSANQEIRLVKKKSQDICFWSFIYDFVSLGVSFRCKIVIRQVDADPKEFVSIMEIPQTKYKPPKKEE